MKLVADFEDENLATIIYLYPLIVPAFVVYNSLIGDISRVVAKYILIF